MREKYVKMITANNENMKLGEEQSQASLKLLFNFNYFFSLFLLIFQIFLPIKKETTSQSFFNSPTLRLNSFSLDRTTKDKLKDKLILSSINLSKISLTKQLLSPTRRFFCPNQH